MIAEQSWKRWKLQTEQVRGCDHDGTWGPTARGFRCCANPK